MDWIALRFVPKSNPDASTKPCCTLIRGPTYKPFSIPPRFRCVNNLYVVAGAVSKAYHRALKLPLTTAPLITTHIWANRRCDDDGTISEESLAPVVENDASLAPTLCETCGVARSAPHHDCDLLKRFELTNTQARACTAMSNYSQSTFCGESTFRPSVYCRWHRGRLLQP